MILPLPPSSHHKNKQAKADWRAQVIPLIQAGMTLPLATELELIVTLHAPWFDHGFHIDPKLPDWDRLVTPLQDAVAEALGFDDRRVMHADVWKRQSDTVFCTVELSAAV